MLNDCINSMGGGDKFDQHLARYSVMKSMENILSNIYARSGPNSMEPVIQNKGFKKSQFRIGLIDQSIENTGEQNPRQHTHHRHFPVNV